MDQKVANDIQVSDEAFRYLSLQRGGIEHLVLDRTLWTAAYRHTLNNDYRLLRPHLPPGRAGVSILDIGSGLGGIDICLQRHYGGTADVVLMDGVDDPAEVILHRKTFNDMRVAQKFHEANGCPATSWIDANMQPLPPLSRKADLVISLHSWCFHYPPVKYLDWVKENIAEDAVLIVDVRRGRDWIKTLFETFRLKTLIHFSEKSDRAVYHAR